MNPSRFTLAALTMVIVVNSVPAVAQAPAAGSPAAPPAKLGSSELQTLVAPIALYPDALVAHILPASTAGLDVVQAARFLRKNNGKAEPKPNEQWNTSVFVLLQFPDVLYRMDENLDWTDKLGQAVIAQQADVMNAIQQVRTTAVANGILQSNDKQTIVVQQTTVQVVPANPQVVYVPTYSPETVVVQQTSNTGQTAAAAALGFGAGVAVGALLNDDDCDWHGGYVVHGAYPVHYGTYAHPRAPYNPRGVYDPRGVADPRGGVDAGRAGAGGQAGLGGGAAGARGGVDAGRAGAGGQAGLGGGAAGARGGVDAGRAGAGGQAGLGGGAAGARGGADAGRAGAGGQAGAGGGTAGHSGGRSSGSFGNMSSRSGTSKASSRGHSSMSGGGRSGGGGGRSGGRR